MALTALEKKGVKYTFLLVGCILFICGGMTGGIVLVLKSKYYAGNYHRDQGLCRISAATVASAKVCNSRGRSGCHNYIKEYKAIWSVEVYSSEDTNLTSRLYDNSCAGEGSLTDLEYDLKANQSAQDRLALYPVGSVTPCIYPKNPVEYPDNTYWSTEVDFQQFFRRSVYLGVYTQSQIDESAKKPRALRIGGGFLIAIGSLAFFGGVYVSVILLAFLKRNKERLLDQIDGPTRNSTRSC